jgi:SRSO17 transposase
LFSQEGKKKWPWQQHFPVKHYKKHELAIQLITEALERGYPKSTVLADAWFGVSPFVNELKRLGLDFITEIKSTSAFNTKSPDLIRTPKGKVSKNQQITRPLGEVFKSISTINTVGFEYNEEEEKVEKVLYHLKVTTTDELNAFTGNYRLVQSVDPVKNTIKYLLSNNLDWECRKIVSAYSKRWVIEEFFRNAKQLTNMEGTRLRSEQGVTLALCLVSWIDFLLHLENYKNCAVKKRNKKPLTVQSIIRQEQLKNAEEFVERIRKDDLFVTKWKEFLRSRSETDRERKVNSELVNIPEKVDMEAA